ncbi:MAG: EpsG family protein [Lactobacillus sp.]|nr:EpsG family protein [Lactobacillus sp.]
MIYFLILIFLLFAWLFNFKSNNSNMQIGHHKHTYSDLTFILVVVTFFIFFSGLRGLTGTDTSTYLFFYETNNYPATMEKIYLNASRFFSANEVSFQTFQIIVACFTIVPLFIQYWGKSENLYFSTFIFYLFSFYLYSFNVSRQALAASILAFGYLFFKKNDVLSLIIGIVVGAIAIDIHKSSLYIFLALLVIKIISERVLKSEKSIFLIGLLGIILSLFFYKSNYVFNKLLSVSGNFSDYSSYIDATTASGILTTKSLFTLSFALIGSLIIMLYSRYPKDYRNAQLFTPFFLFTVFEILQINWISDRMAIFVLPMIPLFFTHIVYVRKDFHVSNKLKYAMCFLIILMGLMTFSRVVIQNFGQILPYLG